MRGNDHPPSTTNPPARTARVRRVVATGLVGAVAIAASLGAGSAGSGSPAVEPESAGQTPSSLISSLRDIHALAQSEAAAFRAATTTTAPPATTVAPTTTAAPTTTTAPPPPPPPPPPEPEPAAPGPGNGDPYDPASWDRLAQCESGGDWAINTGNGYYGGLQFSLSSWQAVGGTGYPHEHPRETQIEMGQRLWESQGWGAWPACTSSFGWS